MPAVEESFFSPAHGVHPLTVSALGFACMTNWCVRVVVVSVYVWQDLDKQEKIKESCKRGVCVCVCGRRKTR